MISIEEQNKLLLNISKKLKRKITAYAIGGTAMMFRGIKDQTLDIDMVFENKEDRESFRPAIQELGYEKTDSIKVYGLIKKNQPEMLKKEDVRFDLFLEDVIHFSDSMKKRASQTHQFNDILTLKAADPHDILLMKCATDREKDKIDAKSIIESQEINWNTIIEEAKNQVSLGKITALLELGEFLEHLKNEKHLDIPKEALDKLYSLLGEQVKKKMLINKTSVSTKKG